MFLQVSCLGLQENPNNGGLILIGEVQLKGAALGTAFLDKVVVTTVGLTSNL